MFRPTRLDPPPPELDLSNYLFEIGVNFRASDDETHLHLHSSEPSLTKGLLALTMPYRREGREYLEHHEADLSFSIPYPGTEAATRVHVAVRFVEMADLHTESGLRHRQDFDRLMDIAQRMLGDMVETGLVSPGAGRVELVLEPLSPKGKLRENWIPEMGFWIGASWLQHDGKLVFSEYRTWDPKKADWH